MSIRNLWLSAFALMAISACMLTLTSCADDNTKGTIVLGDEDNIIQYELTRTTLTLTDEEKTYTMNATSGVKSAGNMTIGL